MLKRVYPFFRRPSKTGAEIQMVTYPLVVRNTDTTAPFLTNQSPAENATNVVLDTNISFSINDNTSGVTRNSINCTVNSVDAIVNGVVQTAFNGSGAGITANASRGYDIVLNPTTDYTNGQTITIVVSAKDNSENTMTSTYSFTTIANVIESYTWDNSWWSSDVDGTSWPARTGGQDLTFRTATPTAGISTSGYTSAGLPTELVDNMIRINGTSGTARSNTCSWRFHYDEEGHWSHVRMLCHMREVGDRQGYIITFGDGTKYLFQIGNRLETGTPPNSFDSWEVNNAGGYQVSPGDIATNDYIPDFESPGLLDMVSYIHDKSDFTSGAGFAAVMWNGRYFAVGTLQNIDGTIIDLMVLGSYYYAFTGTPPEFDVAFVGHRYTKVATTRDDAILTLTQHQADAAKLGLCAAPEAFDYDWDIQWRSDDLSGDTWPSTPAGTTLTRASGGSNATTGVSTSGFADGWLDDDLEDAAVTLTTAYLTSTPLNIEQTMTIRLIIEDTSTTGNDGQFFFGGSSPYVYVGRIPVTDVNAIGIRLGGNISNNETDVQTGPMLIDAVCHYMGKTGSSLSPSTINGQWMLELFINGTTQTRHYGYTTDFLTNGFGIHGLTSALLSTGSTTYSAVQIRYGKAITLAEHRADAIAAGLVV